MHEFGLVEGIVHAAQARANGRPVERVKVRVSALLRAVDESMEQSFEILTTGTEIDGARLEIVTIPGRGKCSACGEDVEISEPWDPCPSCDEQAVRPTNAEEMILEEIEYGEQEEGVL